MARDLPVRPGLVIPGDELRETASRAGGPGGQNVDKVSTRVTLRWSLESSAVLSEAQRDRLRRRLAPRLTRRGEVVVHAGASRSQAHNREAARERLAGWIRDALAVRRPRRPTRPGAGARRRRLEEKRQRSRTKRARGRVPRDEAE